MRSRMMPALLGMALSFVVTAANAQIHGYISREAGFSFSAPGEMKTEKVAYSSAGGGARPATTFHSIDDNIEFSVTAIDFNGVTTPQTDLIKEAAETFLKKGKMMADASARVESFTGRKMTVDLPNNGGRSMAAIYFTNKGYLVELQTTVLPANGDYGTPDTGRGIL